MNDMGKSGDHYLGAFMEMASCKELALLREGVEGITKIYNHIADL